MRIRTVSEEDYGKIYDLVKTAFESAKVSDGREQDFVYELRDRDGYVPGLELVMEEDGEIAAHVMLTEIEIELENGNLKALLVAPLCVKLDYRNQGFGGALLREGFVRAVGVGYGAAFLVGDPAYYERFGFKEVNKLGITNETGLPDEFVLGCEIIPGFLRKLTGKIGKLE